MRSIKADQLFSREEFLATDTVLVINDHGLIQDITTADKVEESVVEHFNGILTLVLNYFQHFFNYKSLFHKNTIF